MMNARPSPGIDRDAARPVPNPPMTHRDRDDAERTIDFERVVFDPEYRARVRDLLNRAERMRGRG